MSKHSSLALIVEDDPTLLKAMSKALRESDIEVREALDYETAVRQLAECRPHIACVDLELPRESGYELCEYVRRQPIFATLPILVTSERGQPLDMVHAEKAGANAFLKKPFSMRLLLQYVHALLRGWHESDPSMRRLRPS
jgi:twitching motility two-component system response regulator PilH